MFLQAQHIVLFFLLCMAENSVYILLSDTVLKSKDFFSADSVEPVV